MNQTGRGGGTDIELPFAGLRPNFVLAFIAAPLAGTLAASAASMALSTILVALDAVWPSTPWRQDLHHQNLWDTMWSIVGTGFMTGYATLVATAAYTAVLGGLGISYYRKTGRIPSRAVALASGVITCVVPCGGLALLIGGSRELTGPGGPGQVAVVVFFVAVSLSASLATAWTFWQVGFAGRSSPHTREGAA